MPDNLDEFEIKTTTEKHAGLVTEPLEEPELPPREPRRRLLPIVLSLLAVLALGALAAILLVFRPWTRQAAAPAAAPASGATASPAPARAPLPDLDESDGYVRQIAAALSSHPELTRWLARSSLVRTATAVVSNIADGETPRPHLLFLAPRQGFRAGGRGGRTVADPAGFAGYETFANVIASVDAGAAAGTYRALEPLFDAAYAELGHPEGFRGALDRAIAALLAVPVPEPDAELVPGSGGFRWADPQLESLTPAQKQFLRTGPQTVRLVKERLRQFRTALGAQGSEESAQAPAEEGTER